MGVRAVWRRLRGSGAAAGLDPADPDLVVVVASFDDAEACSAALARGADPARSPVPLVVEAPALFRHHLRLPAERVAEVLTLTAEAGYARGAARAEPGVTGEPGPGTGESAADGPASEKADAAGEIGTLVILQRVQILDAVHCSQERSRMASVAQRHGGTALGWDALQPTPPQRG